MLYCCSCQFRRGRIAPVNILQKLQARLLGDAIQTPLMTRTGAREPPSLLLPSPVAIWTADSQKAWEGAGFHCKNGEIGVDSFTIKIIGDRNVEALTSGSGSGDLNRGIGLEWRNLPAGVTDVDGIPVITSSSDPYDNNKDDSAPGTKSISKNEPSPHRNTVYGVDHIVLVTSTLPATEVALATLGWKVSRRDISKALGVHQLFYRPGNTTIEVIAPMSTQTVGSKGGGLRLGLGLELGLEGAAGKRGGSYVWGVTFACSDIEHLHSKCLPESTKRPYAAKQKGRLFTTLNPKVHDLSLRVAFISPYIHGNDVTNSVEEI